MKTFFRIYRTLLTGILLLYCYLSYGQSDQQTSLSKLTASSDSINTKFGAEKLYIQFDKTYYTTGDTIWLKAYLFNAPTQLLSARSGLLHLDIANDSNKIVKQYLLPVTSGLSWGNIALDDKIFKPGDYTLRAYTNWMRNFSEETFFYKSIRVADTNESGWLINSKISKNGTKVNAQLQLTEIDKRPLKDSVLQAELTDSRRIFSKQNVQTDKNGLIDLNFSPQINAGKFDIILQNRDKTKKVQVPIILNRPENADVQFLPEGGSLVAGLPAKIGFKAVGEDGRGVEISGNIVDHKDSVVASFKTLHNGMGSFYMQPQAGEGYTAKITLPGGLVKSYPLPIMKTSGTLLQVKNLPGADSLEVAIAATPDLVNTPYYLVGKARGVTCYAAVADLGKEPFMRSRIAKSRFPQGITHFILLTAGGEPLNERMVYIDRPDSLHIDIQSNQQTYNPKDSVALHFSVSDNAGKPVMGNFSMAVTDDAQVHEDSLDNNNIITRMLLTSDLKGYVEEPGYYFGDNGTAKRALDNLLITQGWVNYEPKVSIPFKAEKEFTVQGKVNNVFGGAVKKTHVVLFSRSPAMLFDTVTDNEGRFVFNRFPRVDTPVFVLKAVNRAGKSFNVNIDVDEYATPLFNASDAPMMMPWYINTDTTLMNYMKQSTTMKQQSAFPGGGRLLKEVQIKAKKIVKGSYNLNGPGNADVVLDEKDLEEAGKKTWLQLFKENIKGFRQGLFFTPSWLPKMAFKRVFDFETKYIRHADASDWYFIHDKPIILIVDGVDIMDVYPNSFQFADLQSYLQTHTAEDIKGIEVNSSAKYSAHYMRIGKWMEAPVELSLVRDFAFVEITTRGGGGALIKYTPGIYLYKPLAISWPKQFYKPKYKVADTAKTLDLRSTIDWEPNITTDSTGHATVSFYAGSSPSTYVVVMEGTDFNGNVGYKRRKISIIVPKETTKSK